MTEKDTSSDQQIRDSYTLAWDDRGFIHYETRHEGSDPVRQAELVSEDILEIYQQHSGQKLNFLVDLYGLQRISAVPPRAIKIYNQLFCTSSTG